MQALQISAPNALRERVGHTSNDGVSEGKTKREAMRSLKRYLSRHLYSHLANTPLTT